jgi:hypothetical protein
MSTSLNELLDSAYEEPEPEPAGSASDGLWWWIGKAVLWSTVLALPFWVFFHLVAFDVPYPLIAMVLFVARVLRALLRWIDPRPLPDTLVRPSSELVSEDQIEAAARDGLVLATSRWDNRLASAKLQHDKGQFARTVQPQLIDIIDDRLRVRRGIVRAADPAGARAVLGEQLWTFVTTPVPKNPTPREVAGLISLMEKV